MFVIVLFVVRVKDGTVKFAVNNSGRRGRHGEISSATGLDGGRFGIICKCHQQTNVLVNIFTKDGERKVDYVALGK